MEILSFNELQVAKTDVFIVPVFEDYENIKEEFKEIYDYVCNDLGFDKKPNNMLMMPTYNKNNAKYILFMGLGKKDSFDNKKLLVCASKAIQKCIAEKNIQNISVVLNVMDAYLEARTFVEGALIGAYKFDKYKNKKDNKIENLILISDDREQAENGIKDAKIIAESVNFARDLINEPAEVITPERLAEIATTMEGIEAKVYGREEIKKMGMGAFLAVGQGSRHEQKFIHLTYKPKGEAKKRVAIVGKGITFDSGGLDIKPASSMLDMKDDMSGAACVLAVFKALGEINVDVEVHGLIAACENMPGSSSYKPGDVLTAMNGKTIEVDNTDAEGRLTLADALCFAESLKPDNIIDIATLTGACCVALGKVASGILGNDEDFIADIIDSGSQIGEYFWELPMFEEYFEDLKSDIADFKNSGNRYGGTSAAALFLQKFVEKTPWVHLDIAGTAVLNKPMREYQKGATGVGIRTILNYIINL